MTRAARLGRGLLVLALGGCASYSNRLGAAPLHPGAGELGLALDALVVERGRDYIVLPQPELTYRRGIRDGMDVGGKVHLIGVEGGVRLGLVDRGRFAVGGAAGLALGFEPITNNTTDLVYARALPRLVAELRPAGEGRWPTWIATAAPSLTFTGPLTMFAGIAGAARFIVRPGAALAARWPLPSGRALWLEVTAQPAYAIGDGWLRASYQGGAAITF
jgi:hypothetical protein